MDLEKRIKELEKDIGELESEIISSKEKMKVLFEKENFDYTVYKDMLKNLEELSNEKKHKEDEKNNITRMSIVAKHFPDISYRNLQQNR